MGMVDMSDGDYKKVTLEGDKLTIEPARNNQTWKVETKVDLKFCNASVDFRVKGKPSPPPCAITGTLMKLSQFSDPKDKFVAALQFTDPTGQLDPDPEEPINMWISVPAKRH